MRSGLLFLLFQLRCLLLILMFKMSWFKVSPRLCWIMLAVPMSWR